MERAISPTFLFLLVTARFREAFMFFANAIRMVPAAILNVT